MTRLFPRATQGNIGKSREAESEKNMMQAMTAPTPQEMLEQGLEPEVTTRHYAATNDLIQAVNDVLTKWESTWTAQGLTEQEVSEIKEGVLTESI